MSESPRVFISYRRESDEHCARIGALVEKLRGHGFDATWDEREWPFVTGTVINWMRREVEQADIVLMVFTKEYSRCYRGTAPEGTGMGAAFEASVCALLLAKTLANNKKFLPILIRPEDKAHLPPEIENIPFIVLDRDSQFQVLLRRMEAWLGMLPPLGPPDLGQKAVEALRRPWHPPRPPDRFIGRAEMVRELAAALIPGRRIAIVGAGGIGKTSLASVGLAATAKSRETPGPWLAGVCSHDYSVQPSHDAALAGLAAQLGGAEIPDAQRADFIRQRVDRPDALLYLEGCERAESLGDLLDLLPTTTVLLTSRDRQHAAGACAIELGAMPGSDAAQLLFHSAFAGAQQWPSVDFAEWEAVAQRLGGHPLALRLAGQHLWLEKQTLADLRRIMDTAGFAGFDVHRTGKQNLGWLFDHSAAAVEAQHHGALGAWYVLSLHALAPLPLAPIAASLGIGDDAARARLRGLVLHSLVEVAPVPSDTIGQTEPGWRLAHALLGEWGRTALPHWRPTARQAGGKWWSWLLARPVQPLDSPRIHRRWGIWWDAYLRLCFHSHCVPGGVARYAANQPHFSAVLASLRRIHGESSHEVRLALMQIGQVQQAHGDFSSALVLLQQAADLFQSARGADDIQSLVALGNLADLLRVRGDFATAEPVARRVLAGLEKVSGPEAPATLTALSNLALLLHDKGASDEAEQLARRALVIRERVLGPDDPETVVSLNNLALILQARGDIAGAEPLFRRALAACEHEYGADHAQTLIGVSNLASFLQAAGQLPAAEPLYRRTLAGFERAFGPEHPATLTALGNLGNFLHAKGDLAAAEPLYRRSLEIRQRILPAGHPETCGTAFNLALLLEQTGDLPAARAHARQALDGFRQRLPESHSSVQSARQVVERLSGGE